MSTLQADRKLILGLELAGTYMTPEEFDAVKEADEDYAYELINGVLIVSLYPSPEERASNEELGRLLLNYGEQHPKGALLDGTLQEEYLRIGPDRRRADRLLWIGLGRVPNVKKDVPTIAVEFVSKGKRNRLRDYITKRDEYLAHGVTEYWVIDRFRRILTEYRSDGAELVITEKKIYRPPLLPGFELPVGRLFALAGRWEKAK